MKSWFRFLVSASVVVLLASLTLSCAQLVGDEKAADEVKASLEPGVVGTISISVPQYASWIGNDKKRVETDIEPLSSSRAYALADRVDFYLYDSYGNLIDSTSASADYIDYWSVPAGTNYFLYAEVFNLSVSSTTPMVSGYSDYFSVVTGYDTPVSIMCFPETTTGISVGSSSSYSDFPVLEYERWYSFTATSAYTQVGVSSYWGYTENFIYGVFDSNGYFLSSAYSGDILTVSTTSGGTYYVAVINEGIADYAMVSLSVGSVAADDVYEENDSMSYAASISEATTINLISNDSDWFTIDITPGYEHLVIDLLFSDAQGDIDIYVYDSTGNEVASSTGVSDNEYIDVVLSSSGTHYIEIYNCSGDNRGQPYSLYWDDLENIVSGYGTVSPYIE